MRQLIRAWLDEVVLAGDTLDFNFIHSATGDAIDSFVASTLSEWVDGAFPRAAVAITIFNELRRANSLDG